MAALENIKPNCAVRGILPSGIVTVVSVQRSCAPPASLREILLDGEPKPPTWSEMTNESKV
jgi:hypothetical protein